MERIPLDWFSGGRNITNPQDPNKQLAELLNELIDCCDSIGGSGLFRSTQDMDIYVDAATGSDTGGDGSVATPYATIVRGYQDIPYVVAHRMRIHISSGSYPDFPNTVDNTFEGNGTLAFIGIGTPNVEFAGPYTVTGYSSLGGGGREFTDAGASLGSGLLAGHWIRMLTGSNAGKAYPIVSNGATAIRTPWTADTISVGDTFDIVSPSVLADITSCGFITKDKGHVCFDASYAGVRISVCNISLNGLASPSNYTLLAGEQTGLWLSFVQLRVKNNSWFPVNMQRTILNYYNPLDGGASALALSGITNLDTAMELAGLAVHRPSGPDLSRPDLWLGDSVSNTRIVCPSGGVFGLSVDMKYSALGKLVLNTGVVQTDRMFVEGDPASFGISHIDGGSVKLKNTYVRRGIDAIRIEDAGMLALENASCDSANVSGHGIRLGACCNVALKGAMTLAGATGAIEFSMTGTTVAAPANHASVTDGNGSFVARNDY